jgi:hypothetical protein
MAFILYWLSVNWKIAFEGLATEVRGEALVTL